MKRVLKVVLSIFLCSLLSTDVVMAAESVIVISEDQQSEEPLRKLRSNVSQNDVTESFEPKTEAEREKLPENEQEMINNIENYLLENSNPNTRSFGPTLKKLIASLAFDTAVRRKNTVIDTTNFFGLTSIQWKVNGLTMLLTKATVI